jgi:membrane protein implicated in regulation of membrane protease activity
MLSALADTFWILVLAVVALFAFFVALGAFRPADVAGLTIAMAALALLWVGHATWTSRHRRGRDPAAIRARERRGF